MKRKLSLCLASLAIFVGSSAMAQETDDAAIRAQAENYVKAFQQKDSQALANFWSEDGAFTDSDGKRYQGRASIQNYFKNMFSSNSGGGGGALAIHIDSLRFPTDSAAIEVGTASNSGGSSSKYTAFHVKKNGVWQMADVIETAQADSGTSMADMHWLAGKWTVNGPDGQARMKMKVTTAFPKGFLQVSYIDLAGNTMAIEEIGVNPKNGTISSWTFNSNGGTGNAFWNREGNTFTKVATSYEADGLRGAGIYILQKLSPDKFTFAATSRYISGQRLPNSKVMTAVRDAGESTKNEAIFQ